MTDDQAPNDIPSTEKGPRQPNQQAWTGTGTPRSADDGLQEPGAVGDRTPTDVDPAVTVGATTGSHPADADETQINRSGAGGSGGPSTEDDMRTDGSSPRSMDDLLAGDPQSDG